MPAASTILDRRWFFFAHLAGRSRAQDATLHSPSIVLVSASLPPSLLFTYIHSHTLYPHTSRLTVHEAVRKQHHPLVLSCPCWSFPSPSFFLSLTLCHPSPPRRSTHPVERTIWNSTVRSCTLVSPLTDNSHPSPSHHPTFQPQLCSVALWPPPCSHLPEARTDGRADGATRTAEQDGLIENAKKSDADVRACWLSCHFFSLPEQFFTGSHVRPRFVSSRFVPSLCFRWVWCSI